jgi:hypothetical protein
MTSSMRWISAQQQQRDHAGLRHICAADGRPGTDADPLDLDDVGFRVHRSHFSDPNSGLYGHQQQ